jgi:hypothetical protein
MATPVIKSIRGLRNTRDLRAEILELAAKAMGNARSARLQVVAPVISPETVRSEWDRLLPVLAPSIRSRLSLTIETGDRKRTVGAAGAFPISLPRANYRYEVLRLLIEAGLEDAGPQPIKGLIQNIGASQTPVRAALVALQQAGVVADLRSLAVVPEQLSQETLSRIGALPQTIRFRFERGAQIKAPPALLRRALELLQADGPDSWKDLALSGVAVAHKQVPKLDLAGLPRLDLVAAIGREATTWDANALRALDDGLEVEPNVLAPAPVVVTVVRTPTKFATETGLRRARRGCAADVLLALFDLGLRDLAIQYARALHKRSTR